MAEARRGATLVRNSVDGVTDRATGTPLNVLFVGVSVPDDVMDEICRTERYPPIQSHRHSWSCIRGLEAASGRPVDIVSSLPVGDFPRARRIFIGLKAWDRGLGSTAIMLPFVNVLGLKHATRFASCAIAVLRWLIVQRPRPERPIVLIYGMISAHLWASRLLSAIFGVAAVAILTDPPSQTIPGEGGFRRAVRRIDRWLILKALHRLDGVIALTDALARDFAPQAPAIVIEGIAAVPAATPSPGRDVVAPPMPDEFTILYAGTLSGAYGIRELLGAFELLTDAPYRLRIFGAGDLEQEVAAAAAIDARIQFHGFQPNPIVQEAIAAAHLVVNPRPSRDPMVQYAFPSKLMEYMAIGRPVLTTRLPGIPLAYDSLLYYVDEETPHGFAAAIAHVQSLPAGEAERRAAAAQRHVLANNSVEATGRRTLRFLEEVAVRRQAGPRRDR